MDASVTKFCELCQLAIVKDDKFNLLHKDIELNLLPEIDINLTGNSVICNQCMTSTTNKQKFNQFLLGIKEEPHVESTQFNNNLKCIKEEAGVEIIKEEFSVSVIKDEACNVNVNTDASIETPSGTCYYCYDCGYCIDTRKKLIRHIYRRHKKKKLKDHVHQDSKNCKCKDCTPNTDTSDQSATKKIRWFKCKVCDFCSRSFNCLKQHMMSHSNIEMIKCEKCKYTCWDKGYLNTHIARNHLKVKSYKCTKCEYVTKSRPLLATHNLSHKQEKVFRCTECNYKSNRKSCFETHMSIHTTDKPFKCDKCDYTSVNKTYLVIHNYRMHRKKELVKSCKFECTECKYISIRQSDLDTHVCQHTGENLFRCDKCDYTCWNETHLDQHVNATHFQVESYKCDKCEYSTTYKKLFYTHMWSHTEEKPFRCTECDYGSRIPAVLAIHMRKHTGEKPYQCDKCDYKSAHKANVIRHDSKVHSKHVLT